MCEPWPSNAPTPACPGAVMGMLTVCTPHPHTNGTHYCAAAARPHSPHADTRSNAPAANTNTHADAARACTRFVVR